MIKSFRSFLFPLVMCAALAVSACAGGHPPNGFPSSPDFEKAEAAIMLAEAVASSAETFGADPATLAAVRRGLDQARTLLAIAHAAFAAGDSATAGKALDQARNFARDAAQQVGHAPPPG